MNEDALNKALEKLNGIDNVMVDHLPNVGGFILTFDNEANRLDRMEDLQNLGIDWSEDQKIQQSRIMDEDHENDDQLHFDEEEKEDARSASIPPNDKNFNQLWAFQKLSNNADINMQEGWQKYVQNGGSSKDVIVAVIDTGVNYNHEDLKDKMWKNPGEIPGNGIDDDNNGFVDDVYGVDLSGHNAPGDPMDMKSHGTTCAGIIGAKGNNGKGVIGVAAYTGGKVSPYNTIIH